MGVVTARLGLIVATAIVITLLKAGIVAVLFRATCPNRGDGVRAGSVLTAAGELESVDVITLDNDPRDDPGTPAGSASRSITATALRLDVLRAAISGARCSVDCQSASTTVSAASGVVELARAEFPDTKLYVRSFDRHHSPRTYSPTAWITVDADAREHGAQ